jgi:hypothetical protein
MTALSVTGSGLRKLRVFRLLALLAQSVAAVIPCIWVLQVLPIWWLLLTLARSDYLTTELTTACVLSVLAIMSLIGLHSGKAWGWSCALLVNLAATLVLVLGFISGSRPPRELAVCSAIFIGASAVMMLPGVRAYYSQRTQPWPLSWWRAKRENEGEQTIRVAFATGQLFVSLSGWVLLLVLSSYTQSLALLGFGMFGIAASVRLFRGHRTGVLLTLAWAAFGVIAVAQRAHSEPFRGGVLYMAVYFLVNGFYASAMLARRLAHQS